MLLFKTLRQLFMTGYGALHYLGEKNHEQKELKGILLSPVLFPENICQITYETKGIIRYTHGHNHQPRQSLSPFNAEGIRHPEAGL